MGKPEPGGLVEWREREILARIREITLEAGVPECFGKMRPRPAFERRYGPVEIRGEPPGQFQMRLNEWAANSMEEARKFVACVSCDRDIFLRCAVLSEMYRGESE